MMRALLVLALAFAPGFAPLAHAEGPIARLFPPNGTFFDDPVALSSDGRSVALLATDAASQATLEVWDTTQPKGAAVPSLPNMPITVTRLDFLAPDRVLLVYRRLDARVEAMLVTRKDGALIADKRKIGPAEAIEPVMRDGKRLIALYEKRDRKVGAEHSLALLAVDGHVIAHHSLIEDAEGLIHTRVGAVRPLWWSNAHTQLAAQKIGEYDKARDIRRPDRFARFDTLTEKVTDEHEIEDVLSFTKVVLAHKAQPDQESFLRFSDDRKTLLVDSGLEEATLPLTRSLTLYEPDSLEWAELRDHELLVVLQVDANNAEAVARRMQDKDEIDFYRLDLSTLKQQLAMSRVLVLPGQGRPVRVAVAGGRVVLLRKDRGFDRGGIAVDLYALP